jgi:uncharacterized damage-inducible protein DinB
MEANEFFLTALSRSEGTLKRALDGLSPEDLRAQPAGTGSNPIGWLTMHLTRVQDGWLSRAQGMDSEWDDAGWGAKFGIQGEASQWSPENVHTFDPKNAETLMAYWTAVKARTDRYAGSLKAADLDDELPVGRSGAPPMTIAQVLALILGDNVQHIGQIAYLRGLVKEQGWY